LRIPTYKEIETKVRADLDLQDSNNFITEDEMAGYCNEAIDTAESIIMQACEDYLLTSAPLTLVNGANSIELPSNIYAQKIRGLTYINGDRIYPLHRVRDPDIFYRKAVIDRQAISLDEYSYLLKSTTVGEQDKIILTPPAYESGAFLELWYIRNANRVSMQAAPDSVSRATQLATPIDIPEWRLYLEQYMKMRCYEKMRDMAGMANAEAKTKAMAEMMLVNLKDRVVDNENNVAQDTSHYMEHN